MGSTFLSVVILFGVVFVLEVALFWASTALSNVQVNAGRLLAGAFLAALFWMGALYGIRAFAIQPSLDLLETDRGWLLILVILVGLVVSLAAPAVLFVPLLSVSLRRGLLLSVLQLLLRLGFYAVMGAVVVVVLRLCLRALGGAIVCP